MNSILDLDLKIDPELPKDLSPKIGVIGAGFIVDGCHLPAYSNAGFNVHAIASRTQSKAADVAERHGIGKVHQTWQELVADPEVEILDIAYPPDQQLEIIAAACEQPHIKGILAQKPLAMNLDEARQSVGLAKAAGIPLAVNSNMRYDQSIRALKALLDADVLGQPIIATIDMRGIPDWQSFLREYNRVEILNMGIHHIDAFRYLFGDPEKITATTRTDPRQDFEHIDGISQYTFQYADGLFATSLDDVWAGPVGESAADNYIRWRVEGTDGIAQGAIGWVLPGRSPSTMQFTSKSMNPTAWISPQWSSVWFPDAFVGTMAQLLRAVENGTEPEISGEDNLKTLACVEACYRSIAEERTVRFTEFETSPINPKE